jgi:hypothetical protein
VASSQSPSFSGQHRLVRTEQVSSRQRQLLKCPRPIVARGPRPNDDECAPSKPRKRGERVRPVKPLAVLPAATGYLQFSGSLELGHRKLGKHDLCGCDPGLTVPPPLAVIGEPAHVTEIMVQRLHDSDYAIRKRCCESTEGIPPFPPSASRLAWATNTAR